MMPKYKVWLYINVAVWTAVAFFVSSASLPPNPLSPSKRTALRISQLMPEGWNFFTRDPREERVYIYEVCESAIVPLRTWPNKAVRNWFGIKRTARAVGTDYGMVLSNVPDSLWHSCDENTFKKIPISKLRSTSGFKTRYPDADKGHFLFGELVFVKKNIAPWSWFRYGNLGNPTIKYLYGFIER